MSIVVQLPETAQSVVDDQVASGRFSSANDLIVNLVEQARQQAAQKRIEQLLLEGLDSGPPIAITPDFWRQKKDEWTKKYGQSDKP